MEETPRRRLFAAAWRGEEEDVKSLIESKSVDVNALDENNVTALRFASQYGHLFIVRYLLDHGADPSIRAHDKMDPLAAAVEKGHSDIIELLLLKGAMVHQRHLNLAIEHGHSLIAQKLSEFGVREKKTCLIS